MLAYEHPKLTPNFAMMCFWIAAGTVGYLLGWQHSITAVYVLVVAGLAENRAAAWFTEIKLMREVERGHEEPGDADR